METLDKISKDRVPAYRMLDDYSWVADFKKCLDIKREIFELRKEKKATRRANPTKMALLELVKSQHAEYKAERISFIRRYLGQNMESGTKGNIFRHLLYHAGSDGWFPQVNLTEVEAAIGNLEFSADGIGTQEKEDALNLIEEKLAGFRSELSQLSPPIFFRLENGRIVDDVRQTFFQHWWNLQNQCREACSPQGVTLEKSSEREKTAWHHLGLADAANRKSRFLPAES